MAKAPRQAQDDESLLVAAMANTESEIFTEAMGDEELELDGDDSLEQMEDPVGEEADDEAGEGGDDEQDGTLHTEEAGEADEPGDTGRDQAEDRPVAREQREEPRYRLPPVDPSAQRIADLEARLARVETPRQDQQTVRPTTQELPDPVLDPTGFREGIAAQIRAENQQATRTAILESNFRSTEAAYTRENRREEFELAASQLNELSLRARTDPSAAAAVRSIVNASDPGYALMQWAEDNLDLDNYRQEMATNRIQEAARLLGVDPADLQAFTPERPQARQRGDRQEARQDTRQRGEQQARPQPQARGGRRLPSLNSAGGVGREGGNSRNLDPNGFDGSEDSIFTFATRQ